MDFRALIFLTALGLPLAAAPPPDAAAATSVLLSIDRSSTLEPGLRHLCDMIGPRLVGTPQMDAAVDWAAERFREIGVDSVATEEFGPLAPT